MSTPEPTLGQEPSRLPAANLGDAFAPSPRSSALSALTSRMRPAGRDTAPVPPTAAPVLQPVPDVTVEEQMAPAVEESQSATTKPRSQNKPVRSKARPKANSPEAPAPAPAPGPEPATAPRQTIVYLDPSVRKRAREASQQWNITVTELSLRAVDATHKQLGELLGVSALPAQEESLFASPRRMRRTQHKEPQVQVSMRYTDDELAVIERLAEGFNVARGVLLNVAITAYLDAMRFPAQSD